MDKQGAEWGLSTALSLNFWIEHNLHIRHPLLSPSKSVFFFCEFSSSYANMKGNETEASR